MHLAMILSFWTLTARLVRTETIRLKQREFVFAARVSGLNARRILVRHILPNTAPLLLVQTSLVFVAAIKAEVVLSFLGIGLQDSISWGIMIAEAGQEILAGHYMNFVTASLALFVLVLSVNQLADRLQERLDPRSRPGTTGATGVHASSAKGHYHDDPDILTVGTNVTNRPVEFSGRCWRWRCSRPAAATCAKWSANRPRYRSAGSRSTPIA